MSTMGKMDCHGLSHAGHDRAVNDDQFLIADLNKSMLVHQSSLSSDDHQRMFGGTQGQLLLVAKGMAGAEGKHAGRVVVDAVTRYVLNTMNWFFRLDVARETDLFDELRSSIEEGAASLRLDAHRHPEHAGMAVTLTLAYIHWPKLFVVHAGDNRCYLHRAGKLERITRDHTIGQTLLERGGVDPDELKETRWSNVLWNSITSHSEKLAIDVYTAELRIGDALLLCTDGLSRSLRDCRIAEALGRRQRADATCRELVNAALGEGAKDELTVVVARFHDLHEDLSAMEAVEELQESNGDDEPVSERAAIAPLAGEDVLTN